MLLLLITITLLATQAMAQPKQYMPTRVPTSPKIDGKLDDAMWQKCTEITDFVEAFPNYGAAPSQRTTFKIAYDNTAVYVAAIMYDDPKHIRKQLSARDPTFGVDADYITIGLDTYKDRQNGFVFTVTAAGVQGDAKQAATSTDRSWDAVWMSATSTTAQGWQAEIKIPLSAIRFPKKDVQDWGLQLTRYLRTPNQSITWNPQDPNQNGTINQWGTMVGIQQLVPPVRLSFLPYISSGISSTPTANGTVSQVQRSGGMDVKYGINESFTVDVTLIPDFAQVQSDNVFLNLTPFQVRFNDFRPFFTEGTELFNKAGLFYSRRIGAEPAGVYDALNFAANNNYTTLKNPGITRLYNATKLSGRTRNNVGIGIFNAVTAPMKAKLRNNATGKDTSILTEPLTNYNVIVIDKALKGRSSLTYTNTNVLRQGNQRNANVAGLDADLYDATNTYNLNASAKLSTIWGNAGSYNGYTTSLSGGKVSGILQYQGSMYVESDQYDPNDLGFLFNNNSIVQEAGISLNYNKPKGNTLSRRFGININNEYLYKPTLWQSFEFNADAFYLFRNFWDVRLNINSKPAITNDYFEARTPGLSMKRFAYVYLGTGGSSDSRKKLFFNWNLGVADSKVEDDTYTNISASIRYRFSPRVQVSLNYENENDRGQWGYTTRTTSSTLVAGYNDPIIAFRHTKSTTTVLQAQYSFTPRMQWTMRIRHNWTNINNRSFHNLQANGWWGNVGFINGRNRNFNAYNMDMFYTWDFKWGSRLTLGWKNAIGNTVQLDPYTYTKYTKNLAAMYTNPHSNEVTLKIVYFLDYLDVKRK